MTHITSRVDDNTKEMIQKACNSLGISQSDFVKEALFHFMTDNNHELSRRMKRNFHKLNTRRDQEEMFYFKNAKKRLRLAVTWQYEEYGFVDHAQVISIVQNELKGFDFLDERIKKLIIKQRREFAELLDKNNYEMYVCTKLPKQIENGTRWKKITK